MRGFNPNPQPFDFADHALWERFGTHAEFTISDVVDVMRGHINPMAAARRAANSRRYEFNPAYESRKADDVEVGLRAIAQSYVNNRRSHRDTVARIARQRRGVYRFLMMPLGARRIKEARSDRL